MLACSVKCGTRVLSAAIEPVALHGSTGAPPSRRAPAGANCGSYCSYIDNVGLSHPDCVQQCHRLELPEEVGEGAISVGEFCRKVGIPILNFPSQGACTTLFVGMSAPGQNRP